MKAVQEFINTDRVAWIVVSIVAALLLIADAYLRFLYHGSYVNFQNYGSGLAAITVVALIIFDKKSVEKPWPLIALMVIIAICMLPI